MSRKVITVFEHDSLRVGQQLAPDQLAALQTFYGQGVPWYSLIHNGIKFCGYVGVLQIGDTLYEVLPKADRESTDTTYWRDTLIGMVRASGFFRIEAPTTGQLRLKPHSLLDLYFQIFITEVEWLLHRGLVKKYHLTAGNSPALKGRIVFVKHLQQNLVHQERFYVRHSTYDREHKLHQVLYKALKLVDQLNTNPILTSRTGALLLDFPMMPDIQITNTTFSTLPTDRKTAPYGIALEIAHLLLLNYHPDVSRGRQSALALMFDMNLLWERFVLASLQRHLADWNVRGQHSCTFWTQTGGNRTVSARPDIVLSQGDKVIILDTKWKLPSQLTPSSADLYQMFAYQQLFGADQSILLYPGKLNCLEGIFLKDGKKRCTVKSVPVSKDVQQWQHEIAAQVIL